MAFGGLTGLGPEAIRRLMVQPSSIPFGALNFHPSQMGSLMGGPALPTQFGPALSDPLLQAQQRGIDVRSLMANNGPVPDPFSPGPRFQGHLPGPAQAPAMRSPFGMNPSAAGSAPRWLDFSLGRQGMPPAGSTQGWAPATPNIANPNALPQRVPGAAAESFTPRALQANVQPVQYAPGTSTPFPSGPSSAYPRLPNPTANGAGSIPRGVVNSVDDAVMGMAGREGASSAASAVTGMADDAVRMSAMQMPRVPTANPLAGLGPSVTPVSIAGRAASSPATQTLAQRLLPTLSGMRGGGGAAGALRNFATGPGLMRGIGRGVVGGVADNLIGQPLAQALPEGPLQDAMSGFSTGAGYGFGFGPAGALVGGLGVGIGNLVTGGGVTDLLQGGEQSAMDQALAQVEASGDPLAPQFTSAMRKFAVNDVSVWDDLGIQDQGVRDQLIEDFNRLAPEADQETRVQLLQQLTANALTASEGIDPATGQPMGQGQGSGTALDPQSILALQAQAAGLMAPIAADSAAIGDMGHTALSRLAEGLPPEMAQAVMGMAEGHQIEGQNSANRYMQQAYSAPQLAALGQQNAMTMQIAQQLQQQAIQSLPQFAQTSGGSIEDLLAGQALTGGDTSGVNADIAAMLQAAG